MGSSSRRSGRSGNGGPGGCRGAIQTVGQGLIDHGPVSVPVPVLVNPTWNVKAGRECYWNPNNLSDDCY
ncbi:colicin V family bacteriocin [Enterobacter cloacae]|uniref:colicin V family bacteriocin n=1 Tax=Enterobacter cloacae TaxID=550 RepID=UPI0037049325